MSGVMILLAAACCAVLEQFAATAGDVESFSYRSLSVVHTESGELTAVAQAYFQAPDRYREDSSMSFGTIVTVRRGDDSWGATPRGVSRLSPDQHRRTVERLYRNYLGLLWAVRSGRVEARELRSGALELRVEGLVLVARFDAETGRLLETSSAGSSLSGAPVTERRAYSSFDEETGLPGRVEVFHDDDLAAEITIKRWRLNEPLAPSLFDEPEAPSGPDDS